MAQLWLTCLGNFQVALAGAPLTAFPTDKVQALLVYLALEGQAHARAEVAQFLWPGYPAESARHSLRQTLYRLQQLLPDVGSGGAAPWLLLTRQTVQLNPDAPVSSDVATFRALLAQSAAHPHPALAHCPPCLARLRQAVDLYQGDFLAGFTVADSEPFEEWRRILQEQLHLQMLDALAQLADAAEAAGDDEGALQAARRQITLEPWHEAAHRRVMRLLAQHDQRAAAIAQYNRCRQVLAEELGIAPDAATTALYEQIQSSAFEKTRRKGDKEREAEKGIISGQRQESASPLLPHAATLPSFPTALIGRAQALAEIDALLQRPGARLLTLVGPGGIGKTRLAVAVGQAILAAETQRAPRMLDAAQSPPNPKYADGLFFVSLAPISGDLAGAAALAGAIATALGVALHGSDPRTLLLQMLRQKQLLLILDNFEHLLGAETAPGGNPPRWAVDLVADLIEAAPGVQILVTSRERLKLRSEQLYTVPALTFAATASLAEAAATTAVRLFVQSVQRVQADFQLTATNLGAVLRICRLVEGVPLALELAAANASGLPLNAIADAIAQSAEFLAVDWRDVPERQRSMRALFAWSRHLLNAAEQRILRQSAIFRGGFDYAAAQAVTGATIPLLMRLTDKSLLQWQATATGEGRYTMHELLRQFAVEELNTSGELAMIEERHARYYLAYLAARGLRLGRREPKEASAEIQAELDNVRQAWQWAATQGRLVELEQATYAWWQFCLLQGLETEGRQSFGVAVEGVRAQRAPELAHGLADEAATRRGKQLLAKLLAIRANYLFAQGRDEEMAALAQEAVALGAASGGVEGETFGTFVLGRAIQELGKTREAGDLWRQTLQLVYHYQSSHPESELLQEAHWMAHNWLRGDALAWGDYAGSRLSMVRALQICQALGKRRGELYCLSDLAWTDFYLFDFATAGAGFQAALDLARSLGYRRAEMFVQMGLGEVLRLQGDYIAACTLLERSVTTAVDLALPFDEAYSLTTLIRLHCQLGNQTAATQRHEQLAELLARVKLPKECQLAAWLAAALKAHYAGDAQLALQYAEQANRLNDRGDILFRLVDTALIVGHTRAAVGQWAPAAAAFQQALTAFQQFGNRVLATEPQAGLAYIALAQGDLAGAQAQVETILPVLAEQPHAGYNNPFFIYLTGYRVLAANGDPRALTLLQQGYDLLQQDAATLDDESRQRFLTSVSIHRELVAAYRELRAQEG